MSDKKSQILGILWRSLMILFWVFSWYILLITGASIGPGIPFFIVLSIVIGIFVWIIVGRASVGIINRLLLLPARKLFGKHLFLIQLERRVTGTFLDKLFLAVDDSLLPTLFFFGIYSYVLGSAKDVSIFSILVVLSSPLLGLIVPIIKVLLDSDLVRFYPEKRLLEPVGRQYLQYMKSIAGYTAIFSFLMNLFSVASQSSVAGSNPLVNALILFLASVVMAYSQIFVVVFVYSFFHTKYVERLNDLLRRDLTYLEIQYRPLPKGVFGHIIKIVEPEGQLLEQSPTTPQVFQPQGEQPSNEQRPEDTESLGNNLGE
ncbi:MAG: hypothetical protein ACP6IS_03725 [Candidatus Asgardarchaeia archaeon]